MNKQEAKISNKVATWFWKLPETKSYPFEIKHTRGGDRFNFKEISNHQLTWLEAATTKKGFKYKIVDANIGFNPFDYMMYKNTKAYIIIVFPTIIICIEIRKILKYISKKKSINEIDGLKIADFTVKLQDL